MNHITETEGRELDPECYNPKQDGGAEMATIKEEVKK